VPRREECQKAEKRKNDSDLMGGTSEEAAAKRTWIIHTFGTARAYRDEVVKNYLESLLGQGGRRQGALQNEWY